MTPLQACTQALFHFDEGDGSYVDSSLFRRPLTAPGGGGYAADAGAKFGGHCLRYTSTTTNAHLFSAPFSGSVPFWVDAWVRLDALPDSGGDAWLIGSNARFALGVGSAGTGNRWFGSVFNTSNGEFRASASDAATVGSYQHVLFGLDHDLNRRLFVGGLQVAFAGAIASPQSAALATIGVMRHSAGGGRAVVGRVDELRYVLGLPCPTEDFVPPTAPYEDISRDLVVAKTGSAPIRLLGTPPPATNYKTAAGPLFLRDARDGGDGKIVGTVHEKALPTNTPLRRRVRLVHERSGRLIRETWSSEAGHYAFLNIDRSQRYTVLVYDYEHDQRAVAADNLLPEPM